MGVQSEARGTKKGGEAGYGGAETGHVTGLSPSIQTGCLLVVFVELFFRNINPLSNMSWSFFCQPTKATSSKQEQFMTGFTLHEAQWKESSN